MSAFIVPATRQDILGLVKDAMPREEYLQYKRFIGLSSKMWLGFIDGKLACAWATIPTTMLSDHAYLWLHVTGALKGNEFVFVRQSKIAVEELLRHYSCIRGHVMIGNDKAIKWLKWLGADFGRYEGSVIPFSIRRKNG